MKLNINNNNWCVTSNIIKGICGTCPVTRKTDSVKRRTVEYWYACFYIAARLRWTDEGLTTYIYWFDSSSDKIIKLIL